MSLWIAVAGVAMMAIGALGPWVSAFRGEVTVNGIKGTQDGWIVLITALLAGAFLATYASRGITNRLVGAAIAAGVGTAVCIYDVIDISNSYVRVLGVPVHIAQPGWGLYVALTGAGVVAVASLAARHSRG